MKKFLFILLLFPTLAVAQNISLSNNVLTQIIFPSDIEHFQAGFLPDDFREPMLYKNSIYIQPLGTFENTNLSVVTVDGRFYAIRLNYATQADDFFVVKLENAIFTKGGTIPKGEKTTTHNGVTSSDPIVSKILAAKGYISTRNAVRYKTLSLAITGVYINQSKIYIRLLINNNSQLPFKIESFVFTLSPIIKAQLATSSEVVLEPLTYFMQDENVVDRVEVVYCFEKFSVGADNKLLIDLVENNAQRNITLTITDDIILSAQTI